jgi:hypothetical protein
LSKGGVPGVSLFNFVLLSSIDSTLYRASLAA